MITPSKFSPSWWLRNPHLQTIVASKLRRKQIVTLETERLELPDGDFVDIAWTLKANSKTHNAPWVCIFHGLAGCVESAYANGLIVALERSGFNVVFMHFRGCSGEPNLLAKTYHSGHTDDIRYLIEQVQISYPNAPLHAVGFSLGGNALLK